MSDDRTITLGGQDFPIAPLTLGTMRQAGPAFIRIGMDSAEGMAAQTTLLYLAIRAANPSITPADVDAITGVTFQELKAAVQKISLLMGIEMRTPTPGEARPGEAQPEIPAPTA